MAKKGFLDGYPTYDTSKGFGNKNKWRAAFRARMTGEEAELIIKQTKSSPYIILGVPPTATQEQIRSAYKKLILKWHPDRNKSPEAEEMTKKIIAAYTILKDGK